MPTKEDYAALSAFVYNDVRGKYNLLELPQGWTQLPTVPNSITSAITGFTAVAFTNGSEIIISYKGTDTVSWGQTAQDFVMGNTAALGNSVQLIQAALYYQQVKEANPGMNISFTGQGRKRMTTRFFSQSA